MLLLGLVSMRSTAWSWKYSGNESATTWLGGPSARYSTFQVFSCAYTGAEYRSTLTCAQLQGTYAKVKYGKHCETEDYVAIKVTVVEAYETRSC